MEEDIQNHSLIVMFRGTPSTIDGNRKIVQLRTTSQVSKVKKKDDMLSN